MNFIPPSVVNSLTQPEGQARVFNVVLEQLCLLRSELAAVQGTLMMAADKLGLSAHEIARSRVELRDGFYERIHRDIVDKIAGTGS